MRVCVIAEGLSEKMFIDSVVCPYVCLQNPNIDMIWSINAGGVGKTESQGYNKIKRPIITAMCTDNSAIYTTMFDYYRFPKVNIPNFTYEEYPDVYKRVSMRETAFQQAILGEEKIRSFCDTISFFPFLMLHEYETLMFCDLNCLMGIREGNDAPIRKLIRETAHYENIELINDSPLSAPSKRIARAVLGYEKPSMGLSITQSIGIRKMLDKCQHFKQWIDWLCAL